MLLLKRRRAERRFAWPICWSFESDWIDMRPRTQVLIMCKDNFAVCVNVITPSDGRDGLGIQRAMPTSSKYHSRYSLILLLTSTRLRRIFSYSLGEVFGAQAPEGRCQDGGA